MSESNKIFDPKVSIIIPNYNSGKFIIEAVNSCLWQTYKNIEIIIVDDGSTDGSLSLIEEINNINILKLHRQGAPIARNYGIFESNGNLIKFLDADDILMPSAIEDQVTITKDLKENEITYGNVAWFGDQTRGFKNHILEKGDCSDLISHNILTTSPLHKKESLLKIGGFDSKIKRGQEWNLHVRLAAKNIVFKYHPVPVYLFRKHAAPSRISNLNKPVLSENQFEKLRITYTDVRHLLDKKEIEKFYNEFIKLARQSYSNNKIETASKSLNYAIKLSKYCNGSGFNSYESLIVKLIGLHSFERMRAKASKLRSYFNLNNM